MEQTINAEKVNVKESEVEGMEEKKWYQETWVQVTGLVLSHLAVGAIGFAVGRMTYESQMAKESEIVTDEV